MNLLIVDDEEIEVDLIQRLVEKSDVKFAHIYRAYGVREAIDILKKHLVAIVICDIEMPDGSGHDLTEWIRNRKMDIQVIFSTGHAEFDYAAMALRLEVTDYLLKPVRLEELKKALQKAVQKSPGASELDASDTADAKAVVDKAKEYIKAHCDEPLTREGLAEQYFIHPNYFSRIFKEHASMSLRDYIAFVRMEKAKKLLLHSNCTVSDIALQAGYSNTAYFIKHFRQEMQMTPKQYRKQAREQGE